MLKRLIKVALPLKEVSEQSAREKSIRHGHISTIAHLVGAWPLAAGRAVVFASLIRKRLQIASLAGRGNLIAREDSHRGIRRTRDGEDHKRGSAAVVLCYSTVVRTTRAMTYARHSMVCLFSFHP